VTSSHNGLEISHSRWRAILILAFHLKWSFPQRGFLFASTADLPTIHFILMAKGNQRKQANGSTIGFEALSVARIHPASDSGGGAKDGRVPTPRLSR
jgi:hypothetical protein